MSRPAARVSPFLGDHSHCEDHRLAVAEHAFGSDHFGRADQSAPVAPDPRARDQGKRTLHCKPVAGDLLPAGTVSDADRHCRRVPAGADPSVDASDPEVTG